MVSSTKTKIEKVEEAIQGWQAIINYTDTTLAQAEAGELKALTKLMPRELMAAAKNLDLSAAPGAAAEMEVYNAISFTGGGHAVSQVLATTDAPKSLHSFTLQYEYSETSHTSDTETTGSLKTDAFRAGIAFESNTRITTIGVLVWARLDERGG